MFYGCTTCKAKEGYDRRMIDLHTHTTASDGTDTPFALVKKALSVGVTRLGLADHDTTSGCAEESTAIQTLIEVVPVAESSGLSHIIIIIYECVCVCVVAR
jgi:predicted metal-dependent phosphoesterase TrpH